MDLDKFVFDVATGLVVAFLTLVAKWQWPLIRSLFDEESRRKAAQISGTWEATEDFHGTDTRDKFTMEIKCRGGQVTGTHTCHTGPDKGRKFGIQGSYKDLILTFTWAPDSREALESGTVTAKLVRDKRLEGHGLYIEPADGMIYTSTFSADKQ